MQRIGLFALILILAVLLAACDMTVGQVVSTVQPVVGTQVVPTATPDPRNPLVVNDFTCVNGSSADPNYEVIVASGDIRNSGTSLREVTARFSLRAADGFVLYDQDVGPVRMLNQERVTFTTKNWKIPGGDVHFVANCTMVLMSNGSPVNSLNTVIRTFSFVPPTPKTRESRQ